jgi:hypothetical protein
LRTTSLLNTRQAEVAPMRIVRGLVAMMRVEFMPDLSLPDRSIPDLVNLALLTE